MTDQRSTRPRLTYWGMALLTGILALMVSIPFLWMISGSFKPPSEVLSRPPTLLPVRFTFENYVALFQQLNFGLYLVNTLIVVALSFVGLLLRAMAGYGFAKYNFPGKNSLFALVLVTMMIPEQVTMIPTFLVLNQMGLVNNFVGIVMPGLVSAFSVFLFRQFMATIPDEMIEAARIDGASEARIFWRIILPLSGPILGVQSLLLFISSWNSFIWPLVVATEQSKYTLSVGLALLDGQYSAEYGLKMAGAAVMVVPILVVFAFSQKFIVQSFATSGIK